MLYTEDTRIEALAVHVVGNKSKDEPLTVSPVWGIERSGFFNGREKWAKGFENQRV